MYVALINEYFEITPQFFVLFVDRQQAVINNFMIHRNQYHFNKQMTEEVRINLFNMNSITYTRRKDLEGIR